MRGSFSLSSNEYHASSLRALIVVGYFRKVGKGILVPVGVCDCNRTKFWKWKFCGDRKIGLLESWRMAVKIKLSIPRMQIKILFGFWKSYLILRTGYVRDGDLKS